MSNDSLQFLHGLGDMVRAAESVPGLEARIRELETADTLNAATIVELNKQIIDHVNAHTETKSKLQNAEVARDNAEYRFLEADDAKGAAVRTLESVIEQARSLIAAVTPPEPVVPKPSYEGKWLVDVEGWKSLTLEQWIENGGAVDRFTVVKPTPVPLESVSTSKVDTPTTVETSAIQSSDVQREDGQQGGREQGQSEALPTVGQVGSTTGTTTPMEDTNAIEEKYELACLRTATQEVASSPVPFADLTNNQSANVHTGSVESEGNASAQPSEPPKATEDGETDWYAVAGFHRTAHCS